MSRVASVLRRHPVLVTGGAGFIGCNLADRLATEGRDVRILDALVRPGVEANLDWLRRRHPRRISHLAADVRDVAAVGEAVRDAEAVFHFAAQVAVTTSLADPRTDAEVNVGGTLNLLEALRRRGERVPLIFASTNKVYGDLADIPLELGDTGYRPVDRVLATHGIGEARALDFHTPYGCSKGAADQYVLDYARSYGLPTVVLRMSCIYGPRQCGTEDQGWVAHFLMKAFSGEPITVYGDGQQVRDVLHVSDAVDAYCAAWRHAHRLAGRAFNLGGGPANAVSLRQVLDYAAVLTGRPVRLRSEDWRPGDQRYFVSDRRRIEADLGLAAPRDWRDGIADLAAWIERMGAAGAADSRSTRRAAS
jgi:CDP-paratose 2-epimerase